MSDDNKIKEVADAVKGIVEAVPIYQDAIQPAAKQVGLALETVAKTINLALAPISALVWGYDQIKEFVSKRVAEKLAGVPLEQIRTPSPQIAGPALEALRYVGHNETLRELYANLLATSLDSETARRAHPAFVEIIRALSPDEARIMRLFASGQSLPTIDVRATMKDGSGYRNVFINFSKIGKEAGCDYPDLTPAYLDNLCRLGLLCIPPGTSIAAPGTYEPLESDPGLGPLKARLEAEVDTSVTFERKLVVLTPFGRQFSSACVLERGAPSST